MLFVLLCTDKPDSASVRAATREAHLAYLADQGGAIVHGGPMLDENGAPAGSLLVVDVTDRAAAEQLAAADPYALADLFDSVTIGGHRLVIRDGRRVA